MDQRQIPAPRKFGCPVCKSIETLFFNSMNRDGSTDVICRRDEWRGGIRSAIYEQYFVKQYYVRAFYTRLISIGIIVFFIASLLVMPSFISAPIKITAKNTSTLTNWTIEIEKVSGSEELPISTVLLIVTNAENSTPLVEKELADLTWGAYYRGLNFTNTFPFDYVNEGDYFILNRTHFESGSIITLTDKLGTIVYLNYTIKQSGF